jgi:hypothetical protein
MSSIRHPKDQFLTSDRYMTPVDSEARRIAVEADYSSSVDSSIRKYATPYLTDTGSLP